MKANCFSNKNDENWLLLGTKENVGESIWHFVHSKNILKNNLEHPLGGVPRKNVQPKLEKVKIYELYFDDDNNVQKFLRVTIQHKRGWYANYAKYLKNTCDRVVFNKISGLQPANAIKMKSLTSSFKRFCLIFRNSWFKEQFLLTFRAGPYPRHVRFLVRDTLFPIYFSLVQF